jgi:hypothetical protein
VPLWEPAVSVSQKEKSVVWGPVVSVAESRDSRNRKSRGHMHFGIGNPKTPTRDKTEVTGIMVIWTGSLAKRANGNLSASGF